MRTSHKLTVAAIALALLLLLLLVPRHGHGQPAHTQDFGDFIVHFSAISTSQLPREMASKYGITRSDDQGLLNIAVEQKSQHSRMVNADVGGTVTDLFGHTQPVHFIETDEAGEIDYLGAFPLNGTGNYRFRVNVGIAGRAQLYVVRFNRDYIVD